MNKDLSELKFNFNRSKDDFKSQIRYSSNEYIYSSSLELVKNFTLNHSELRLSITKEDLQSLIENWDQEEFGGENHNISYTLNSFQIKELIHSLESLLVSKHHGKILEAIILESRFSDVLIAELLGINRTTLYRWQNKAVLPMDKLEQVALLLKLDLSKYL